MKRTLIFTGLVLALVVSVNPPVSAHEDEPHAGTTGHSLADESTTPGAAVASTADEHDHEDHPHGGETEAGHGNVEEQHADDAHEHADTETAAHAGSEPDHAEGEHETGNTADISPPEEDGPGAHADGHEHDHATDHGQPASTQGRLIAFLGKFHPLAIHFPIALILFAVALEGLGIMLDRSALRDAAYYCVLAGAISAAVAAALGWAAGSGAQFPQEVGSVSVLWLHRWLGVSTAGFSVVTAALGWTSRKRPGGNATVLYRLLLVVTAVLISVAGHFGASLVFGLNHFTF